MNAGNERFRKKGPCSIDDIAAFIGGEVRGDASAIVDGINTIVSAGPNEITFLTNKKYSAYLAHSNARACVLLESDAVFAPSGMTLIISRNPHFAYALLLDMFYDDLLLEKTPYISPAAFIDRETTLSRGVYVESGAHLGRGAFIGTGTVIMGGAYIGGDVVIGNNVYIGPNVNLVRCIVGNNAILHSGVRIGQDGFGFAINERYIKKIKQLGSVRIGDDVEIGANSCIDCGAMGDTVIGSNTKIDNLVQIGHNVIIGSSCFIAAQTGIAGSTKIGNNVVIGGQVGIAGHLTIGNAVQIAAKSGVMQDIPDNSVVGGIPAMPIVQWHRQSVMLGKMTKR